jgi:hypothetical protein
MNIRRLKNINPEEMYDEKDYDVMELIKNYVYVRDETLCQICGKIGSDCHHEGHINLMRQTLNNPYLSKLISSGMLMNSRLNF